MSAQETQTSAPAPIKKELTKEERKAEALQTIEKAIVTSRRTSNWTLAASLPTVFFMLLDLIALFIVIVANSATQGPDINPTPLIIGSISGIISFSIPFSAFIASSHRYKELVAERWSPKFVSSDS